MTNQDDDLPVVDFDQKLAEIDQKFLKVDETLVELGESIRTFGQNIIPEQRVLELIARELAKLEVILRKK